MKGLIDHELIEDLKLISKYLAGDVDEFSDDEIKRITQKYKHLKYNYRKFCYYRKTVGIQIISFEEYLKWLINNKVATPEERKSVLSQRFFDRYHNDEEFRKRRKVLRKIYDINNVEKTREYRRNYLKRKRESDPDYYKKLRKRDNEAQKRRYDAMSEEERLAYRKRKNERISIRRASLSPEEHQKLLEKERAYKSKYCEENIDKLYQWYLNYTKRCNVKHPMSKEEYIEGREARKLRVRPLNLEECDLSFLGEDKVIDKNLPKEEINRRRALIGRLRNLAKKNCENTNIISEYKKKNGIVPKARYSLEDAVFLLNDCPLSNKNPEEYKARLKVYRCFKSLAKKAGYVDSLYGTRQYIKYIKACKEENINYTYKQVSFVFVKGSMDKDMKNKKLLTRRLMIYKKLKVIAAKCDYQGTLEGVKKLVLTHIKPSELKKD